MRILLDTNVLIAALISRGLCFELFEHCIRTHQLLSCPFIREEFREKLVSKFRFTKREARDAAQLIFSRMRFIKASPVDLCESPDPDDIQVLGAAASSECEILVTGDHAPLQLKEFRGTPILSPRDFWQREQK